MPQIILKAKDFCIIEIKQTTKSIKAQKSQEIIKMWEQIVSRVLLHQNVGDKLYLLPQINQKEELIVCWAH